MILIIDEVVHLVRQQIVQSLAVDHVSDCLPQIVDTMSYSMNASMMHAEQWWLRIDGG